MFGAGSVNKGTPPYNFPKTKLKNVTCVNCKHQFIVREVLYMRGQQVPLLMECGHSICYGCTKLYPNKPCPLCALPVQVDNKSSESYPLHIYALGLVVIANNRPIHGEEPDVAFYQTVPSKMRNMQNQGICYECEVEATLRCPECSALYCQPCYSKIHGKALQKHTKIRLTETIKDVPLVTNNICSDICNELIGYFCVDCKKCSCSHCMLRFHSKHNHVTLEERNQDLIPSLEEVQDNVVENLQYVQQTVKKLNTIQISPTEIRNQETVESSITQHFAHLHGVLQNIEKKMIAKIHERRCQFHKNIKELQSKLLSYEERLRAAIMLVTNAKENMDKTDVEKLVNQLKEKADVPCHLVEEKLDPEEKVYFEAEKSIIDTLQQHCTLHMPSMPEFHLLRTKQLPENYQVEPPSLKLATPTSSSYTSNELQSSMRKSISTISLGSSKFEVTPQTDSFELVKVVHVVDPSCFFVQSWSMQKQAEELSNILQEYSVNAPEPNKEITVSTMYVVHYTRDNVWRRGRVTKIHLNSDNTNSTYDVLYVDNGYLERNVTASRFRMISSQLTAVPILAVKCALHNVTPKGARWSKEATHEFRKRTNQEAPISMRISNSHGNVNFVDLYCDPIDSQPEPISMRETMIHLQFGTLMSLQRLTRTNPLSVHRFFYEELAMETWTVLEINLVESPDCIYAAKIEENKKYISQLTKDMTLFYENNSSLPTLVCPLEIGVPCALLHIDGSWYRGMITQILNENNVHVFCVDYGYTLTLNQRKLRRLSTNYMNGRAQAIRIALKDLKPLTKDKDVWSPRALEFVKKYLTNQKVRVIAMSKENNVYNVHLYINGQYFNTLLVSSNLAETTGSTTSLSTISTSGKRRSKKKKKKIDRSLAYNMKEDDKDPMQAEMLEPDPFKVCVQVHQARSPDCIYVSEMSRERSNFELAAKIQAFYSKYHSQEKINWSEDMICTVYSKKDKNYFRARILKILSEKEALVSFHDLAAEEVISIDDIQPLNATFQLEPAYVFKVKLAGILPCGGSGTWPSSSCQKLNDIINENQNCRFYITKVAETEENGDILVQLWIRQSRPEGPLAPTKIEINSVNKMLVEVGLALPVKGYNDKADKILAVEFKRQLQEMQVTSLSNDEIMEDIKWYSTSPATPTESPDTSSEEEKYSSATNISNDSLPQNVNDWIPAIPIETKNFIAVATYLDHDGAVYLHHKKKGKDILLHIESMLNDYYKKIKIKSCDKEWKEGDICIAQYHCTKKWYRGKVLQVIDENTIEVQFVDYGNIEECTIGLVKKNVILGDIPIQCTKCYVLGLNPDTEDGKWKTEDLDKIHLLLVEKDCKVSVIEREDTHLVISITLMHPEKRDLISYITDELRIRLSPNPVNLSDSKILNNIDSDNISTDSPDVVVEQYTTEDKSTTELYEDTDAIENIINVHEIISGSSIMKEYKDDTSCGEDYEVLSLDDSEIIKKEAIYSTPQVMSVENLATYVPLVIPNGIDTFQIELCCIAVATVYYGQLGENKQSKVLNNYYNQYKLLMEDMQVNAVKQPLIKNLAPNAPCCAQFEDNKWYRCIIQNCENVKDENIMKVRLSYVDFGNKEDRRVALDNSKLYTLKEEWLSVPIMAIRCALWHVSVPPNVDFFELMKEIGKMFEMSTNYTIAKVKERHEDSLKVELYFDQNCKELLYGSLIKRGLLQIKKTKED